jgi:sRNA-binding carbon storage regulator CsrA
MMVLAWKFCERLWIGSDIVATVLDVRDTTVRLEITPRGIATFRK